MSDLHVVLGATGGIGRALVTELTGRGLPVRAVSRSITSSGVAPGAQALAADVTDPSGAARAVAGAAVVHHAAQPPYTSWPKEFPALTSTITDAAARVGARLVLADNLYAYGPSDGPLRESTPQRATDAKGVVRREMAAELLRRHDRGDLPVALGRVSDYFGPGGVNSNLGEVLFERALAGKPAQWVGRLDQPHTVHYLPDVARGLLRLAEHPDAPGRAWHLPAAERAHRPADRRSRVAGARPAGEGQGRGPPHPAPDRGGRADAARARWRRLPVAAALGRRCERVPRRARPAREHPARLGVRGHGGLVAGAGGSRPGQLRAPRSSRPDGLAVGARGACQHRAVASEAMYEPFAGEYAAHAETSSYNALYDRPAMLELAGPVAGLRVLDAGCGPGLYAAELLARGARVVAFDQSPSMVELARQRAPGADEVRVHDLAAPLDWLADGSVDLVVLALVLRYVDDRVAMLRELRRVLAPGGALILSTEHPTAVWQRSGGSYFEVGVIEESLRGGCDWPVRSWRLPLSTLCQEFFDAGLLIERLVEPRPLAEMAVSDPVHHARLELLPAFVMFRLRPSTQGRRVK